MDVTVDNGGMVVVVSSFAFKTGAPEANLVLDVRFLPDPRPLMQDISCLDGTHDAVEGFIREQGCFDQFFEVLKDQAVSLITECRSRGGRQVHFAFGCVAGMHRSVFVAERLAAWLRNQQGEPSVQVYHREQMQGVFPETSRVDLSSHNLLCRHDLSSPSSHSRSISSSCSTSPSSSGSQPSSVGSVGPCFRGTYHPDEKCLHFQEHCSVPAQDMGSVLASGLNGVKALRARRRASDVA